MAVTMKKYALILSILLAFPAVAIAQHVGQKDSLVYLPAEAPKSYDKTTGKLLSIDRADLQKSGIGDLRNRLTGMIPGLEVIENGGGIVNASTASAAVNYNSSAGGNTFWLNGESSGVKILVDGIPVPFNQLLLEPNQIESITVLSDVVDKSKAGPLASYGAIMIKTRKGEYNTPFSMTVDAQTGVNFIGRLPGWVNGGDYARLNNMARVSAGMDPLYSDEALAAFDTPSRVPGDKDNNMRFPMVDYKSKMLNNAFSTSTFGFDASAGSQNIKYHLALNGMNYGDLIKGEKNDYNKLNVSASFTARIGQYIEMSAGFMGLLSFRRKANINWYNYRSVPEVAYPLILGRVGMDAESDVATMVGQNIYGVSKIYENNYYATLMEGGRKNTRNRSGFFNANVDIDFSWLLKGLKSKTYMMTSSMVSNIVGKNNDYIAYYWDQTLGVQELSSHKGVKETSRSNSTPASSQMLSFYEKLYYDWSGAGHDVHAAATYYQSSAAMYENSLDQKIQYLQADAFWSYEGRYNVETSAQYAGSSRFGKGKRWGFFPTVGVSWVATNEDFLKDNSVLTNLKVHGQFGEIPYGSLFGTHYLSESVYNLSKGMGYGPAAEAGDQWFGSDTYTSKYTTISRLANENLTWERLRQTNVGIDIEFIDRISVSADWYTRRHYDIICDILSATPTSFGVTAAIYDNYEATVGSGFNVAVGYNDSWGDFRFAGWASASVYDEFYDVLVEDNYIYDYQKLTGASIAGIYGLEYVGKYSSQEEIDSHPAYQERSSLKVGDLMYKDQNDDGKIDANDRVVIGHSNPDLRMSLNLTFAWKNLDLTLVGTGRFGQDINLAYSSYFTGMTGNNNYSQFMMDELGEAFPRIDYNGVPNNEVTSSFWIRRANWFKLQTVNLGYTIPIGRPLEYGLKSIRFDIAGNNLFTATNIKYIDPEDVDAGLSAYPLFRTLTFGVKLNF